jgi:hypothetical protein
VRAILLIVSGTMLGLALAQVPGELVTRSLAAWQTPPVQTYWHDVNRRLKADRLDSAATASSRHVVTPRRPVQRGLDFRAEPPVDRANPAPTGCEPAFSHDIDPDLSFILRSCET